MLTPHVICFLADSEIDSELVKTLKEQSESEQEYLASQDFDRQDYRTIEEGSITDTETGYYDPVVLNTRVVERLSDHTFWRMTVHHDSWSSLRYGSLGDYGDICEVRPVLKVSYEPVR